MEQITDDSISRSAAIDAIKFGITYAKVINKETGEVIMQFEQSNEELLKATDRIMELPTIERKRGKWILDKNGQFRCSNCEQVPVNRIIIDAFLVYDVPNIKEYMKYCPMCGADMKDN